MLRRCEMAKGRLLLAIFFKEYIFFIQKLIISNPEPLKPQNIENKILNCANLYTEQTLHSYG